MDLLIVIGVIVLLAVFVVSLYNRIIVLDNRISNAFGQIEVQLKQRNDLVPNLIETVKGYAAHEKGVFEAVTQARASMASAGTVQEKAQADGLMAQALKSLFAVAEAYPELKANQNFQQLQGQLSELEQKIAYSRQFYNDTVLEYNNVITTIPGSFLARPMGKGSKPMFAAPEAERAVPKVQF